MVGIVKMFCFPKFLSSVAWCLICGGFFCYVFVRVVIVLRHVLVHQSKLLHFCLRGPRGSSRSRKSERSKQGPWRWQRSCSTGAERGQCSALRHFFSVLEQRKRRQKRCWERKLEEEPQGIEETAVPAKTSTVAKPSTAEKMGNAADSTVGEPSTAKVEHLNYFTLLPRCGVCDVAESAPQKLGKDHSHAEGSDPPPVIQMDCMFIKADRPRATCGPSCGCGL
eukprot:5889921-Amphidinium_carterae.2